MKLTDNVIEKKIVEIDKKIVTLSTENVEKKIINTNANEADKKQNSTVM